MASSQVTTLPEWTAACTGGDASRKYPYGPSYEQQRCSDLPLAKQRGQIAPLPTGSVSTCRTAAGVYDLSGNVWEWLADTRGADEAAAEFRGGGFASDDAEGLACTRKTPLAQPVTQQRPEIGFRCCADLDAGRR